MLVVIFWGGDIFFFSYANFCFVFFIFTTVLGFLSLIVSFLIYAPVLDHMALCGNAVVR